MMMPALDLGLHLLQDIRAQSRLCSQHSLVLSFHSKKRYHLFPNNEIYIYIESKQGIDVFSNVNDFKPILDPLYLQAFQCS